MILKNNCKYIRTHYPEDKYTEMHKYNTKYMQIQKFKSKSNKYLCQWPNQLLVPSGRLSFMPTNSRLQTPNLPTLIYTTKPATINFFSATLRFRSFQRPLVSFTMENCLAQGSESYSFDIQSSKHRCPDELQTQE